jgi:hypothetical protein
MKHMKLLAAAILAFSATAFAADNVPTPPAGSATTKPVGGGNLELRASTAFNNGQWSLALPMLKQLAEQAKDKPDKLAAFNEQIRVCEKNINDALAKAAAAGTPAAVDPTTQPSGPRQPIPAPKDGQVTELQIKDLGNFDYDIEKGGNIPADVKRLGGTKFRTRGYMIPLDQAEAITEFALVPSLFACCFGQPPQIQHTLVVHCPKGKAVTYFPDEITVEGILKVEEKKDDGYIVSIFEIDAQSVKPAPK